MGSTSLFFAQRVAYDLLQQASMRLAETSLLLSYAAIAVLIVTQLVGVIGMFLVLRPSLPTPTRPSSQHVMLSHGIGNAPMS